MTSRCRELIPVPSGRRSCARAASSQARPQKVAGHSGSGRAFLDSQPLLDPASRPRQCLLPALCPLDQRYTIGGAERKTLIHLEEDHREDSDLEQRSATLPSREGSEQSEAVTVRGSLGHGADVDAGAETGKG